MKRLFAARGPTYEQFVYPAPVAQAENKTALIARMIAVTSSESGRSSPLIRRDADGRADCISGACNAAQVDRQEAACRFRAVGDERHRSVEVRDDEILASVAVPVHARQTAAQLSSFNLSSQ
jgi:hypothetical protein